MGKSLLLILLLAGLAPAEEPYRWDFVEIKWADVREVKALIATALPPGMSVEDARGGLWVRGTRGDLEYLREILASDTRPVHPMLFELQAGDQRVRRTTEAGQEALLWIGPKLALDFWDPVKAQFRREYLDLGLRLTLTPTVRADGLVDLEVRPEVNALRQLVSGQYASVEPRGMPAYHVRVKDGDTVVLPVRLRPEDYPLERMPELQPWVEQPLRLTVHLSNASGIR